MVDLAQTQIAVYALGDLVSRGSFSAFRVYFCDDYDQSMIDAPAAMTLKAGASNFCFFPQGTYDVYSKTDAGWVTRVT